MRISLGFALTALTALSSFVGVNAGRTCHALKTPAAIEVAERQFNQLKPQESLSSAQLSSSSSTIKVHFHVISKGSNLEDGNIPDSQINDQMTVLNKAFKGSGLRFTLATTNRIYNPQWFSYAVPESQVQNEMKQATRIGGAADLNVWSIGFEDPEWQGLLGYATFPDEYTARPWDDGVLVLFSTLPGGSTVSFDLGQTLTHEVGHWVGLYHTFQGGCDINGDKVWDTPAEESPASGCPVGRDTCKKGLAGFGLDPIRNFMDYSDDACMDHFSFGQIVRARLQLHVYRGIKITF